MPTELDQRRIGPNGLFEGNDMLARANAMLFYQLARFLVWGQSQRHTRPVEPELERLLIETASLLAGGRATGA